MDHEALGEGVRAWGGGPGRRGDLLDDPTRAIDATGLLDTPHEERFDRFTSLARAIWRAPMSSINLFDADRAFFKSQAGMGGAVDMPARETFCATVLTRDEPVVVPDATADPAFAGLAAVTGDLGIRFYAGHPVRDQHGTLIGTMCVYDVEPREFGDADLALLAQLAACVEEEVRTSSDRDLASSVQKALLPHHVPPVEGYTFAATCVPTGLVAGDAFDHREVSGGHYVLVADVMGKGTAAAILMAAVRATIRAEVRQYAEDGAAPGGLGRVLARARDVVQEDLDAAGAFVTTFLGFADPSTGSLRFVDAGHGLTVVVHSDGSTSSVASTDLPLGVDPTSTWTERELTLAPGDTFVCFSDGLLDVMPGAEPPSAGLAALVASTRSPAALVREVERLALGVPTRDDVTVLAVRRDEA